MRLDEYTRTVELLVFELQRRALLTELRLNFAMLALDVLQRLHPPVNHRDWIKTHRCIVGSVSAVDTTMRARLQAERTHLWTDTGRLSTNSSGVLSKPSFCSFCCC